MGKINKKVTSLIVLFAMLVLTALLGTNANNFIKSNAETTQIDISSATVDMETTYEYSENI